MHLIATVSHFRLVMQIVSRKAVSELGFLGGTEAKIQKLTFLVTVAT